LSASQIYQDAIKALATAATGEGRLDSPDGRALVDNPLCGDRVEMEVTVADGRVAALAHQVRGCLLCRAIASVIGKHAAGASSEDIARISSGVSEMLEKQAPPPTAWKDLEAFAPVHGHRSRYRCVQLPFEALLAALRAAGAAR
jgi:NifU-like protein involved in Fe-S cluster formation